jgi:hypothetical protein
MEGSSEVYKAPTTHAGSDRKESEPVVPAGKHLVQCGGTAFLFFHHISL